MGSTTVTWAQALAHRASRLLPEDGASSVAAVVRLLGSVPAADPGAAELAVRTRSAGLRPGCLAEAVADGSVVDAFAVGGGVHHLVGQEGADLLAVRAAGRQWERRSWVEHYGLAPEAWPGFRATVRELLADGPLTLPELARGLRGDAAYAHLGTLLSVTLVKPLTWLGDVAVAPAPEGGLTLRRLDVDARWPGVADVEEAGPRAVAAYAAAYGPVTGAHLHHRFCEGLSAGRARLNRWTHQLAPRLVEVDVEGTPAHVLAEDVDDLLAAAPSTVVHLLPRHDPWVMGPGTADPAVVPPDLRAEVTRGAGVVVVGGVVRGTWTRKGDDLVVHGTAPHRGLGEAADRLSGLLGRELRVVRP